MDTSPRYNLSELLEWLEPDTAPVGAHTAHTNGASHHRRPVVALSALEPVVAGCDFLRWCRDHQADVSEPLWHAMLSNLARCEDGRAIAHAFSKDYPGYSPRETDEKFDHALAGSAPITCARIRDLGFPGCPPAGHGVSSPVGLGWHRDDVRATETPLTDGAVITRLDTVTPEPVTWLWPGRIPRGKLALGIGEPGQGKTYAAIDIAARTTRAATFPDGAPNPGGAVVLFTAEDGLADTIRPRLEQQGGDASRLFVLQAVRIRGVNQMFNLSRDLGTLEEAILETKAVLVIADPLSAYLGDRDSHKDAEIRALLSPLAALAERRDVAILGLLHLNKTQQRRILHRAQASIAFVAAARTVLVVAEDVNTPGRRLLVSAKNNLGPEAPALAFRIGDAGLTWEPGTVTGNAEALLASDEPESRTARTEREQAMQFLRDALADGPARSTDLARDAKANGIAQRTLWRAKTDLAIKAEKQGNTGPWFWMLPGERT